MHDAERQRAIERLKRLARLLDSAIPVPGLDFRFGLDALIGLLPGVGDTVGAFLSSYIISEAGRLGAPRMVLLKMALNVAADALVGTIPVAGDVFDVFWKANLRNIRLLESYLENPRRTTFASSLFVGTLCTLLVGFVAFTVLLAVLLLHWLWRSTAGG